MDTKTVIDSLEEQLKNLLELGKGGEGKYNKAASQVRQAIVFLDFERGEKLAKALADQSMTQESGRFRSTPPRMRKKKLTVPAPRQEATEDQNRTLAAGSQTGNGENDSQALLEDLANMDFEELSEIYDKQEKITDLADKISEAYPHFEMEGRSNEARLRCIHAFATENA